MNYVSNSYLFGANLTNDAQPRKGRRRQKMPCRSVSRLPVSQVAARFTGAVVVGLPLPQVVSRGLQVGRRDGFVLSAHEPTRK